MAAVRRKACVWVRGNKIVKSILCGARAPAEAPHQEMKAGVSMVEHDLAQFLDSRWQIVGASAAGEPNTDILLLEEWL